MPVPAQKIEQYLGELLARPQPSDFRVRGLISEMKRALKSAPDHSAAALLYTAIGIAFALLGEKETSFEHHENACRLASWDFIHPNNFAVTLDRFGRVGESLKWYFIAADTPNGHNAEVLANLAVELSRIGAADDARSAFEEAARIARVSIDIARLANTAAQLGYYDVALLLAARDAVASDPRLIGLHPAEAIAAASSEWRDRTFVKYELAVAWRSALRLGRLEAFRDGVHNARALDVESPLDDDVFGDTQSLRDCATYAGLVELQHG